MCIFVCVLTFLTRLVPGASVVKGFNTLSSWSLQNGPLEEKQVCRREGLREEIEKDRAVAEPKGWLVWHCTPLISDWPL